MALRFLRHSVLFVGIVCLGMPSLAVGATPFGEEQSVTVEHPATAPGGAEQVHTTPDEGKPVPPFVQLPPTVQTQLAGLQTADGASGATAFETLRRQDPKRAKSLLQWLSRLFGGKAGLPATGRIVLNSQGISLLLPDGRFLAFPNDDPNKAALFDWNKLHPDEQRILGASLLPAAGTDGLTGKSLFASLAAHRPLSLLSFTNLCARLRSSTFTFPAFKATGLSFVRSIKDFERDRCHVQVDPSLKQLLTGHKKFSKVPGHGEAYPDSFKQNDVVKGGAQLSFSPDGTQADVDIDMYNVAGGGKNPFKKLAGAMGHLGEVITPGKTDPFKVHDQLRGAKIDHSVPVFKLPGQGGALIQTLGREVPRP